MRHECLHPITLYKGSKETGYLAICVPCGKCAECLMRRRLQWIPRLLTEFNFCTAPSYFVTLTYADEFLPFDENNRWCFNKKQVQDYIKRLRYYSEKPFKYYCAAEYGEKSGRPHYHMLLYGFVPKKGKGDYFKVLADGNVWPFGGVDVHPLSPSLISYTTKYILSYIHTNDDFQRPFILCSKGLGTQVLEDEQWIKFIRKRGIDTGKLYYRVNGATYPLPRFLRNKLFSDYERFVMHVHKRNPITMQKYEEESSNFDDVLFRDSHNISHQFLEFMSNHKLTNISKQSKL